MTYVYHKEHQQSDLFGGDIKEIMGVDFDTNDLVTLESQIDWDLYTDAFCEAYSNQGRASLPVRQMFGLELLKHIRKGVSDEYIVEQMKVNVAVMWFCGYTNIYVAKQYIPKSSSSMTHFRNRVNKVEGLAKKVQNIHLKSMMKHVPKRRRKQFDQDSTVIDESVSYPNDIDLLASICEKAGSLISKVKKVGNEALSDIIAKGRRIAKKLKYEYHFGGKKSEKREPIKKKLIKIGSKLLDTIHKAKEVLKEKVNKKADLLIEKIGKIVDIGRTILEQQTEIIITGTKKVKDRIVSLHKDYVRPIIKGKAGKITQFGSKVQLGMIGKKLSCIVSLDRDNVHDKHRVKDGVELFEEVSGKSPSEFGGDRGYRDAEGEVYEFLEKKGITNGIQGTKEFEELDKKTRKRLYNRRAFTEPLIGNIKGHRGCNNNKHKKENVLFKLICGSMSSNYLRCI